MYVGASRTYFRCCVICNYKRLRKFNQGTEHRTTITEREISQSKNLKRNGINSREKT